MGCEAELGEEHVGDDWHRDARRNSGGAGRRRFTVNSGGANSGTVSQCALPSLFHPFLTLLPQRLYAAFAAWLSVATSRTDVCETPHVHHCGCTHPCE